MKIGFIGLGIMGAPMVRNLLKGNHTVYVNDLNEEAVEMAVTHGATAVASLQEMAEHAEAFITMLPNGAIVKSVLLDAENGLYPYLKDGQAVEENLWQSLENFRSWWAAGMNILNVSKRLSHRCPSRLSELGIMVQEVQ